MNSLPKTVTRQRRGCDLNPEPSVPESSTLTTRLPNHCQIVGRTKDTDTDRRKYADSIYRASIASCVKRITGVQSYLTKGRIAVPLAFYTEKKPLRCVGGV